MAQSIACRFAVARSRRRGSRLAIRGFFVFAALHLVGLATAARADVVIHIDNSAQRMRVYRDGALAYVWKVSTARPGYWTPPGSYYVQRMHRMWYSRKYDMSPMPYSLFFYGGFAIHGTYSIRQLGRPASHGCVRLHPANARALYGLVGSYGGARVLVTS
jgi:lipoprotein-anchoring transpeptidase ErfK/SrfK